MSGPTYRICVVGSGWRFTSGISYYTCRLSNALARTHIVDAVLMRNLIPRMFYPGRRRVGTPVNTVNYDDAVQVFDGVDWWAFPSLMMAALRIRRRRPELLILQWWTGAVLHSYLLLATVARAVGAKVVVEFHEVQDTGEKRLPLAGRWLRLLGREVLRRCDGVVVHSEYDRRQVEPLLPDASTPVHVVPHGPFDHHAVQVPAQRTPGPLRLLFFGTIRPYKGLEHLVEAFHGLSDDEVNGFRLQIVGETWEGWSAPVVAARTGRHRQHIEVVNQYVHDDEVTAFFAGADAVVLPYTRSSASGPLHIAMAAGLPVVLTDVGGLRDAAGDYAGASWVAAGDVPALRDALRQLPALQGRRYADPRSWTDTVLAYEELMAQVCAPCG
jgi:glycosyltransferase involved in cell wall biosynthesis